MSYSFRRPYLDLKKPLTELYSEPVRASKGSTGYPESVFEKPYLDGSYREMHLDIPEPDWPVDDPRPIDWPNWPNEEYPQWWPDPGSGWPRWGWYGFFWVRWAWPDWPAWPDFPSYPGLGEYPPGYVPSFTDNPAPVRVTGPNPPSVAIERCKECMIACMPALDCDDLIVCRRIMECIPALNLTATSTLHLHGSSFGTPKYGAIDSVSDYAYVGGMRIKAQVASAFSMCSAGDPGWHISGEYKNAWLTCGGIRGYGETCDLVIQPDCSRNSSLIKIMFIDLLCNECYDKGTTDCVSCRDIKVAMNYETLLPEASSTQTLSVGTTRLGGPSYKNCSKHFSWGVTGGGALSDNVGDEVIFTAPSGDGVTSTVTLYCTDLANPTGLLIDSNDFTTPDDLEDECNAAGAMTLTTTLGNSVVAPGGSLTVNISGGVGPYTWALTTHGTDGSDWSLDESETETGENVINLASGSTCAENGAYVTITVTDQCGAFGYDALDIVIRNSQGHWNSPYSNYFGTCGSCGYGIYAYNQVYGYVDALTRWRCASGKCCYTTSGGCSSCGSAGAWAGGSGPTPPVLPNAMVDDPCTVSGAISCNGYTGGTAYCGTATYEEFIC